MFNTAISFNQDIGSWDVGNVVEMIGMFQRANSFNQDLSMWNVVNVTNEPKILPLFQVRLRDAGKRDILDWVFETDVRELNGLEKATFVTHIDNPPERAHAIWIGVADVSADTRATGDAH